MKNEYIIVKHVDEQEAKERGCAATLYYCGAGWHFSAMRHNAEVFTNKRKAVEKMKWADKYAGGSSIEGKTEVIKKPEKSKARRQQFMKLTLGDWSGDGHARDEDFILLSNYDVHRIRYAYKESCKRTGIIFHSAAGARYYNLLPGIDLAEEPWREVWGEYNENWICPEAERILLNDGIIRQEEIPETGLYSTEQAFEIIMRFIALSMPEDFTFEQIVFEAESINAENNGELNVTMGYGLFE